MVKCGGLRKITRTPVFAGIPQMENQVIVCEWCGEEHQLVERDTFDDYLEKECQRCCRPFRSLDAE
jgi:hypothetical protein